MTDVKTIFGVKKSKQTFSSPGKQSTEAAEDYAVKKVVHTIEGTIETTPSNDSDIVNKKYVDDSTVSITDDGTYIKLSYGGVDLLKIHKTNGSLLIAGGLETDASL